MVQGLGHQHPRRHLERVTEAGLGNVDAAVGVELGGREGLPEAGHLVVQAVQLLEVLGVLGLRGQLLATQAVAVPAFGADDVLERGEDRAVRALRGGLELVGLQVLT